MTPVLVIAIVAGGVLGLVIMGLVVGLLLPRSAADYRRAVEEHEEHVARVRADMERIGKHGAL